MNIADLITLLQAQPDHSKCVLVDGYEGGFDEPHLRTAMAYPHVSFYGGAFNELPDYARTSDWPEDKENVAKSFDVLVISRHQPRRETA